MAFIIIYYAPNTNYQQGVRYELKMYSVIYKNSCCILYMAVSGIHLSSIRHFLHMAVSGVHFVLNMALFAQCHGCLGRTFCALYGTFCTWMSRAYILCSIQYFLHLAVSGVHFVLYTALFAHGSLGRTFCAQYGTFCTWMSQAYILCAWLRD